MPDFGRRDPGGGDPSLTDINRTDQFLDALAAQQQPFVTDRDDVELAQLLAGWRDDIRETPMGHVVTPLQAEAALDRVTRPAAPRRRFSLAVVGSAAAAVLAIGGFGAVVAGSGPGDALYGLRTMLFGEQVQMRDDAVILAAQTEMQQVQQLIEQGDWQQAQAKLEAVTTTVATVDDVAQKEELIAQWQELTVKVEAQDPVATVPPGAPLPTFPELPAAVLDQATTSSETTAGTTSDTTAPSSETTAPSSETTGPSSETTTAPSETTGPAPTTTAPTSAPTTTAPAPSTTPTTSVGQTRSSAAPSTPTSTTVVLQSTSTSAAAPTTSAAPTTAAPTTAVPTTPSAVETTPTAVPTTPAVEEETPPSPVAPVTTTTPVLPLPGE
ncbi:anti-sigma-D factor RsdA [Mycolicibacterium gilvum]|uniref:anti-sigma-D factor RsdA n=1 Tax=Mycolicibacterium gilvum TaxID=1804 RepID=UPI0040463270